MTALPFLSQRLLGRPLLATPQAAAAALAWLGDRLDIGGVMLDAEAVELAQLRAETEGRYRAPREYRVEAGIATIPVIGSLVSRSTSLQPPSGLTGYSAIGRALDAALADDEVAGILLEVDSGGGEASGVLDLARRVRQAAQVKPLWSIVDEEAGSAAFAIASGAEQVIVPRTGLLGSIGAVALHLDRSGELARRGQRATVIRSAPRKARPSSVEPLTDADVAEIRDRIADLHDQFAGLVAEHRGLSLQAVNALEGAILRAPHALEHGLADAIMPAFEAAAAFREYLGLDTAEPDPSPEIRTPTMTTSFARPTARAADADAIRREMQARFSGIMGLPEAQGPMATLASHLACETSLSVEEAAGVLAIAKATSKASGGTDFREAMSRLQNPQVGPDGGEEDDTIETVLRRAREREGRV